MGSGQSFEEKQKKIDQSFKEKQEKVGEMVKSWKDLKCNTLELVEKYQLIFIVHAFEDYYKAMEKYKDKDFKIEYVCGMVKILEKMDQKNYGNYGDENLVYYYMVTIGKDEIKYYLEMERRIKKLKTNLGVSRSEEHPCDLKL